MHSVYVITNLVTGKWYVGKTCGLIEARWRGHLSTARSGAPYAISRSIRKHGEHNFEIHSLGSVQTDEEASAAERLWILLLESHKSQFGYNLTLGGDGVRHNEATRQKVSKALTGRKRPQKDRDSMSAARLRYFSNCSLENGDFSHRKDIPNEKLVALYQSGLSLPEIAEQFETYHSTVARRLNRMGVVRRPVGGPVIRPDLPTEQIVSMYLSGRSMSDIGYVFKTSRETIRKRLVRAGIEIRPAPKKISLKGNNPPAPAVTIQNSTQGTTTCLI